MVKIGVAEVARSFGVKGSTVETWARTGELPATKENGVWVFDSSKMDSYLRLHFSPARRGAQEVVKGKLKK